MVVVTAAAALGAKVFAALSITGAFATGVTFATVALGFLTQAALGFALNALAPKPKLRGANRGYQVNTRGSALDHQIIYGEARVGGVIIFEESVEGPADDPNVDNQFLLRVYAHAGHEIEGYQDVYIDGKKVTEWRDANDNIVAGGPSSVPNGTQLVPYTVCDVSSDGTVIPEEEVSGSCSNRYGLNSRGARVNNMTLRFYDGTQTTADATLVADSNGSWNTDCVLNETAYMVATFAFDAEVYPNGVPEITCTIKGKKCFDPRSGTTAYSKNPAICIRDYLTNSYGLNEDTANIDDTLVATAANVCDEIVETGINRFTCNGAFVTSVEPADILADLLTSMGGLLWYSQGKWRMKPAYWTAPSLTLTEDDLRSNVAVKTRHSRRDNFNIVKGTFRGPETNWQVTDYPEVPKAGDPNPFLEADNDQESVVDLDLPFTDNSKIARRIARIFLERNRQQLTISATFGMRAFGLQIGDNVRLSLERFGWVEKTFEVNSWTFGLADDNTLQVQMTLREISESVFDDVDDGVVFELDNTKLADPFLTAAPTNLTATDGGFIGADGTFVNSISVSWDVVKPTLVRDYVLEWKKSSATNYNSVDLKTQNYDIPGVEDGVQYDIRVKTINTIGVPSDYASITFTPGQDTTAPGGVTITSAEGGYGSATLRWTEPSDKDLFKYKIYRGTSPSSLSFVGASASNIFTESGLSDSTTYYYRVSAVDFSGNEGSLSDAVSVTTKDQLQDGADGATGDTVVTGVVYYQPLTDTQPTTPTATSYDTSTGQFTGLTADWATTQPPVEITDTSVQEWKSVFTVTIDGVTSSQTINFGTPTGAIQVTTDIQSDNYVAGTSGWTIERDTGFAEFGSAAIRDTLSVGQIPVLPQSQVTDLESDLAIGIGRASTFVSATEPTANNEGDIWHDTANDKIKRWDGTSWVQFSILADSILANDVVAGTLDAGVVYTGTLEANQITAGTFTQDRIPTLDQTKVTDLESDLAIGIGRATTFYTSTAPTANNVGDIWYDTANEKVKRWDGTAWVEFTIEAESVAATWVYAGTLTAGQVNAVDIDASSITVGTLNANRINIDGVTLDTDLSDNLIIKDNGVSEVVSNTGSVLSGSSTASYQTAASVSLTVPTGLTGDILLLWSFEQTYPDGFTGPEWGLRIKDGATVLYNRTGMQAAADFPSGHIEVSGATGAKTYTLEWWSEEPTANNITGQGTLTAFARWK